jgi:alkanesulfonate monooxygenase SsuD/methylene tetrahydromethanopterin reductase-like flavin-dependent oxidoreductase (luciferase family)
VHDHSLPGEAPLRWATVVAWAREAERCGLSSVWVSDHLVSPLGRGSGGFEPLAALAGLARCTTAVRLGTLVLCAPLRPPAVVANALATVDVLSGGRLTIGMGAGRLRADFDAAGVAFHPRPVRLEQLEEAIAVVRGAFGGGPFTFTGRHFRTEAVRCLPRPSQSPAPPIWVGGRGDGLLGLVARAADGWNTVAPAGGPAEYRRRVAALERACHDVGRDPGTVRRSVFHHVLVGEDEADLGRRWRRLEAQTPPGAMPVAGLAEYRRRCLVGTVEEVGDRLAEWAAAGVSTLVANLGALPFSVTSTDDLELLASVTR